VYRIDVAFSWDETTNPQDVALVTKSLVYTLAIQNLMFLRYNPNTPQLSNSGVRYKAEKRREQFYDIGVVLSQGHADCEDLCAWRIAELWFSNHEAWPHVIWFPSSETGLGYGLHVQVVTRYGIEDPSAMLGMR
jgi:hypothetical protein